MGNELKYAAIGLAVGFLASGLGGIFHRQNIKIPESISLLVPKKQDYNLSLSKNDLEELTDAMAKEPSSLFKDLDGDGKKDIVYGIERTIYPKIPPEEMTIVHSGLDEPAYVTKGDPNECYSDEKTIYEVMFRKNLGNGKFAKPFLIFQTETKPKGIQFLEESYGTDPCEKKNK